ncbi:MAG: hypothetical protein R2686_06875 [Candidatus Nanopelagicales bacterium]
MQLEPLEADLLNWLFDAAGRRTGVIVDSADFLALHPEVDRHEVTTAVEILESLGAVKAFRTEAGAMKQVRLTPEAFLLVRPDAPAAETVQNITHNTMIGSPGGTQSVVATATLNQHIPNDLLARLAELEAEFTNPQTQGIYGELVAETRGASTSGDQSRIAKALEKVKHFLSMIAVDAASQLTIAGATQLPAIVQSLNS